MNKQFRPGAVGRWVMMGVLLFSISQITAAENPLDWLQRMQKALHVLDYEGRFVYQTGPHIESLYIVHRVHGENELERLVALNGEPREVIRGNAAVAFIKPGQRPINVGGTPSQYTLSLDRQLDYARLESHYQIQSAGQSRVAGRIAQIVEILPKDNLRYGHRLYLDQATALPLRSVLLDAQNQTLSQNLFVDLKVGDGVPPIEHDLSALLMAQPKQTGSLPLQKPVGSLRIQRNKKNSPWFFAELPVGYEQVAHRRQLQREHFVFSDGLSLVSLYIEQPNGKPITGHSSMGATQTLALQKHAQQITLIGEAPIATLQQLAEALQSK